MIMFPHLIIIRLLPFDGVWLVPRIYFGTYNFGPVRSSVVCQSVFCVYEYEIYSITLTLRQIFLIFLKMDSSSNPVKTDRVLFLIFSFECLSVHALTWVSLDKHMEWPCSNVGVTWQTHSVHAITWVSLDKHTECPCSNVGVNWQTHGVAML